MEENEAGKLGEKGQRLRGVWREEAKTGEQKRKEAKTRGNLG